MTAKNAVTIAFFIVVRGIAWLLMALAALSFLWGGRAIHSSVALIAYWQNY